MIKCGSITEIQNKITVHSEGKYLLNDYSARVSSIASLSCLGLLGHKLLVLLPESVDPIDHLLDELNLDKEKYLNGKKKCKDASPRCSRACAC